MMMMMLPSCSRNRALQSCTYFYVWDEYYKTYFAITQLTATFDALFEGLREFKTVHICIYYIGSIRITSN